MKKAILFITLCASIYTIKAQSPTEIWGITEKGGDGFGTVFKTDSNGNNQVVLDAFKSKITGKNPMSRFCEAPNGKLYSVMAGGVYDEGVLMELDPTTRTLIKKIDFNYWTNGSYPNGLTLAENGKLYGVCLNYNYFIQEKPSIFEYDVTTNSLTKKAEFTRTNEEAPVGELLLANNGKLYGLRNCAFSQGQSELFEYDVVTNVIVTKKIFDGLITLASPLVQTANGKIYGMTVSGGGTYSGTIYEYDLASNTMTTKYEFGGNNNGALPYGGLEIGDDGLLYGMTLLGEGTSEDGTLFKFDPSSSVFTKVIDFNRATTGSRPHGTLKKGRNGLLYGMTAEGGAKAVGTLFQFNPATSGLNKLVDFDSLNGSTPLSSFVQASNGKLYASTYQGGKYDLGVLFEYDMIAGLPYKKITDLGEATNGSYPNGSMYFAGNGKIYIVAPYGGAYDAGVLIECDPKLINASFTKKIDFNPNVHGTFPLHAPVMAANGKLYGTTEKGGTYDDGTLYEYDLVANTFTTKINFKKDETGSVPASGLVRAFNEKLYGLTQQGGKYNTGVLFEFDAATGRYTKKADCLWSGLSTGYLIEAQNRKLYGVVGHSGGIYRGTLFEYDITQDILLVKNEFLDENEGIVPCGSLVEERISGKLYGLTTEGGTSHGGTIFEYDPATGIRKKLHDFADSDKGWTPKGTLLLANNGKLYGTTSLGGAYGKGVMFEFDHHTGIYTKKIDFKGPNGMLPQYSNLVEVCKSIPYEDTASTISVCESTSFTIKSGIPKDGYTFQWSVSTTGTIPLATSADFTIATAKLSDSGIYICEVRNGCRTIHTVNKQVVVLPLSHNNCKGVGVDEKNLSSYYKIYPNPASNYVQLLVNDPSTNHIHIELINVLGQTVYKGEQNLINGENNVSIFLGTINSGIYYVKIMDSDKHLLKNEKLIKN